VREDRDRRARSFGAIAADYDRYRPPPPAAALDWLLPATARRVLDVGAGTGALTRLLTGRVDEVVAVEPDRRMVEVLAARTPGAGVIVGAAEALPLGPGTVDAVLVASAWHWMDPGRAVAEFARVLAPGGVMGLLWNGADRTVPWLAELLGRSGRRRRAFATPGATDHREAVEFPVGSPFGRPRRRAIAWSMPVPRADLIGLAGTYSSVITLPDDERRALLARVERLVDEHPDLAGQPVVDLPMTCRMWRVVRRRTGHA